MLLDKSEWFDVYRTFRPDATQEEYDLAWDEFQTAKEKRNADLKVQ